MGLTRLRAEQISDIDYKQAVRVITVANVTLAGGAPTPVDGVNLSAGDRVLVTGQSTGNQNGLYQVQTVGSGSNGTWVRTSDGNTTGEIEAGMIVMVTEGTIYADTQWKLITDNPIVIGTTALTFTQNYMANSISSGTSNVVVNSNANVTVSSAGTANVLTISNTGAFVSGVTSVSGNVTGGNVLTAGLISATGNVTGGNLITGGSVFITSVLSAAGNVRGGNINTTGQVTATGNIQGGNVRTAGLISATGNVTGNYILGNGALLTGVITSVANINNGTSNVTVVSSGGNVTVGVGGTSNVAVFANDGAYFNGNLVPATSNVYSLGSSTNRWANLWLTGNTIYLGNAIITSDAGGDIIIDSSGSFAVPVGTTAERSEVTGAIRYNTTVGVFETYDGAGWNTLAYGTQTDFPFGDYGSVSDAATTDAFGVSIASTFDCNSEGQLSFTDLADGEAYVGA